MRRRSMFPIVQTFASAHRGVVEREYADASRREAERAREMIATAQASGVFGDGRLARIDDARTGDLLNPTGLCFGGARWASPFLFGRCSSPVLCKNRNGKRPRFCAA